jgi:large subunit ribosomal protein L4
MPKLDVFNMKKEKVSSVELDDAVFGAAVNNDLFYEAVNMQQTSRRAGNAATKTRGMVRGGGKKPYRQKGTGQARAGSSRSPVWVGGAVTFGPHPRDYSYRMPKKARKAALRSALSMKVRDNQLVIIDKMEMAGPKTKDIAKTLSAFDISKALILDQKENVNLFKSARNIRNVKFLPDEGLNVYDLLRYDHLVVTVAAIRKIEGALKK